MHPRLVIQGSLPLPLSPPRSMSPDQIEVYQGKKRKIQEPEHLHLDHRHIEGRDA